MKSIIVLSDGEIIDPAEQSRWLDATTFFSDWFQRQTIGQIRSLLERDGLISAEGPAALSCVENCVLRLQTQDDRLIDLHIDPHRARFAIVVLLNDVKAPQEEEWRLLRDDCLFRVRNGDMDFLSAWNITRRARDVMERCLSTSV